MTFDPNDDASISETIEKINDLADNDTISAAFLYTSVERREKIADGIIYYILSLFYC